MDGEPLERVPLRDNGVGQGLVLTTVALMGLGVVMVFSAAGGASTAWYRRTDVRQALFAAAALVLLGALWRVDYRWLARRPWAGRGVLGFVPSPAVLLLAVGLAGAALVLVPGIGHSVGGCRRWLRFWEIGIQPSEVLKFALLIALAALLARPGADPRRFSHAMLPAVVAIGLAVGLVVKHDFGQAAIIGLGAVALLFIAGVPWWHLMSLAAPAAGGFYAFVVCDPKRWARIDAMLHPFAPDNASAYQPLQSMIAVASGASPAGLGGGLAKYGYLPEGETDFIFSIVCNELGLPGAAAVIALLAVWAILARKAAASAPDRFGALLAGGLGFLIVAQAAMHVAVAVVWMPPTGVALPFVSAGGTSLLMTAAATALIASVASRRRTGPATRLATALNATRS